MSISDIRRAFQDAAGSTLRLIECTMDISPGPNGELGKNGEPQHQVLRFVVAHQASNKRIEHVTVPIPPRANLHEAAKTAALGIIAGLG